MLETRMHSSRMRTARSSSRRGGGLHQAPPRDQVPPNTRHPRDQAPLRTRHHRGPGTPLRTRHPPRDQTPRPCGQTHTCKNITLPQTSFASGKKEGSLEWTPLSLEYGTLPEVEDLFCSRGGSGIPRRGGTKPARRMATYDVAKFVEKPHETRIWSLGKDFGGRTGGLGGDGGRGRQVCFPQIH